MPPFSIRLGWLWLTQSKNYPLFVTLDVDQKYVSVDGFCCLVTSRSSRNEGGANRNGKKQGQVGTF